MTGRESAVDRPSSTLSSTIVICGMQATTGPNPPTATTGRAPDPTPGQPDPLGPATEGLFGSCPLPTNGITTGWRRLGAPSKTARAV